MLVGAAHAAVTTGEVQGSVVDEAGRPVSNARVLINKALPASSPRPLAPPIITGPQVTARQADASGRFQAGGLPPGQYVFCAQTTVQGLLDPCHWAATAPTLTVAAGQTITGVKITMANGAVVSIHLDDPKGLLKPVSGVTDFDCQFHAVTTKGHHYNAPITGASVNGRDHAVTIPFGTALSIQVISPHLIVNDSSGKPAAATAVSAGAGMSGTHMNFTVTGVK